MRRRFIHMLALGLVLLFSAVATAQAAPRLAGAPEIPVRPYPSYT